ncbi:MAG: tetratricopeptide repeat protein, partial [Nannocystaceae bacterium]
ARFALGADAPPPPVVVVAEAVLPLAPGAWQETPPDPSTGARLRDLGIGHLLRGETTLAREAAEAAATRLPEDPGPHLDLARIALADGSLDDAEAQVREADTRHPGHPTAAWLLARIRQATGNHTAALTALEPALRPFPRDRELLLMQATSLFRLERDPEAETVLLQILEIDPEHLGAHALLTKIYMERGDTPAAAKHQEVWDRVRPASADRVITERARQQHPDLDHRTNRQYILELKTIPRAATWAIEVDGTHRR